MRDKSKFSHEDMEYPTDRLTWGELRRKIGGVFDRHGDIEDVDWVEAHRLEREVAEIAYEAAGGERVKDRLGLNVRHAEEVIHEVYLRYGISSGRRETHELIRRIQVEAARQAGRPRQ